MKVARNKFGDISLDIPERWQDRSILTFAQEGAGDFAHNVTVTRQPIADEGAFVSFCDQQIAQLTANLKKFRVLERESLRISDRNALRVLSGSQGLHGKELRQMHYFVLADRLVLIITGTALEATIEDWRENFAQIALSLRFE